MKKCLVACVILIFSAPAFAQQQQAAPEQYQAIIQALRQQRDAANDQATNLSAQLLLMNKEIADLKAKAEADAKAKKDPDPEK